MDLSKKEKTALMTAVVFAAVAGVAAVAAVAAVNSVTINISFL